MESYSREGTREDVTRSIELCTAGQNLLQWGSRWEVLRNLPTARRPSLSWRRHVHRATAVLSLSCFVGCFTITFRGLLDVYGCEGQVVPGLRGSDCNTLQSSRVGKSTGVPWFAISPGVSNKFWVDKSLYLAIHCFLVNNLDEVGLSSIIVR